MTEQTTTETTGDREANDAGVDASQAAYFKDVPATPDQARAKIAQLRTFGTQNPDHPLVNRRHPLHGEAQRYMSSLYQQVYPSGVVDADNAAPSAIVPAAPGLPPSVDAARAEIASIRDAAKADPAHPYNDHRHPEHAALHKRMNELYGVGAEDAVMDPNSSLEMEEFEAAAMTPITDPAGFEPFMQNLKLDPADSAEQIADGKIITAGWMAELGLPAGDASRLVAAYNKNMSDPAARDPATRPARRDAGMRALKAVWRGDFDAKLAIAERVVGRFDAAGDGQFSNFLRNTGLDIDPHMVRALFEAAQRNRW